MTSVRMEVLNEGEGELSSAAMNPQHLCEWTQADPWECAVLALRGQRQAAAAPAAAAEVGGQVAPLSAQPLRDRLLTFIIKAF